MDKAINILDDYQYRSPVGDGYFSLVHHYFNKKKNHSLAVKVLKKKFLENKEYIHRFEREILLLLQLSGHKHVVELIDEGKKNGIPFYIMPLASQNLDEYIAYNNDKLTLRERLELFDQVLAAIVYAHSRNILHRDISPRNVLVFDRDGKKILKVSDFGLGKNWAEDSGYTHSVVAQYGQPIYAAPEQLDKLNNADARSDIYSLGKLLDFILTGKTPRTVNVSGGFKSLVTKAIEYDSDLRYKDVEEFKVAYEQIKNLILSEDDADLDALANFINKDKSIDWKKFHRFAVNEYPINRVYSDYLAIIIEVLLEQNKLGEYLAAVGDSTGDFVEHFIRRLGELPGTGWPFDEAKNFTRLLGLICWKIINEDVQFVCFKTIWKYAYEYDQWSAQDIVKKIITREGLSRSLQERFAVEILNSEAIIKSGEFKNFNIPPVIKRAISQKIVL